ncbi:MAG: hypothetical protein ACLFWH_15720 [Actinomycetota bacterium]
MKQPARRVVPLVLWLLISACTGSAANTTSTSQSSPTTSALPPTTSTSTATTTTQPDTTSTSEPRFCTEIGCDSILEVQLTEVDIAPEATYDVEICLNEECAAETVTIDLRHPGTGEIQRGASSRSEGTVDGYMVLWAEEDRIVYYLPEADYDTTASVSVRLMDSDGNVLADTGGPADVPLERSQPNGPGCPPVCFFGRMTV